MKVHSYYEPLSMLERYMCEARPRGLFKLELLGSKALKNWPKYKHCLHACQVHHKSKRVMLSSKDSLGGFNE